MSRSITIRRTVTGPTNTFSDEFQVSAAVELVLEETVPDTATAAESGEYELVLPIPNQDAGDQIKALMLEATGEVERIRFYDASGVEISSSAGSADVSLAGSGSAFFFPTNAEQTPPEPFDQNTDIGKIGVLRPDGASGNITLYGYALYDPTM